MLISFVQKSEKAIIDREVNDGKVRAGGFLG